MASAAFAALELVITAGAYNRNIDKRLARNLVWPREAKVQVECRESAGFQLCGFFGTRLECMLPGVEVTAGIFLHINSLVSMILTPHINRLCLLLDP